MGGGRPNRSAWPIHPSFFFDDFPKSIKSQKSKQPNTREELTLSVEAYNTYKTNYGKNIQFDPDNENFCKYESNDTYASSFLFTASIIPPASLQMVEIYFDTATYDEIKRDVKVTIA